jgi:hypothetical protein
MLLGVAVFLVSAAALAYEVLVMRLLSIIQWHHFAFMVISLALLGFGASGTFLALTRRFWLPRFGLVFSINAAAFALTSVLSFAVGQSLPLNPLEILWDRRQVLYLLGLYIALMIPFFCAANCIGLALSRFRDQIPRIYRFDLMGAGTGALALVGALFFLKPWVCLRFLGSPGFVAAACVWLGHGRRRRRLGAVALLAGAMALPLVWPATWLEPKISQYKGLPAALRLPDARVLSERVSPLGWLTVVRSPVIPFRYAPGMGLTCESEPPPQLGLFTDGDAFSPITRDTGAREALAYLDCLTSALPYTLLSEPGVLVLGAGGGMDVLNALYHGAGHVDAVELNPQVVKLLEETYGEFAGRLYDRPRVTVHVTEARGFTAGTSRRYDLIQIALLDAFSAAAAGGYALHETYLYTVQALQTFLDRLAAGGILAITRWLKMPPRDGLKIFATAVQALEGNGVKDPNRRLVLIRSWNTTTLLVKNGRWSGQEIASIRTFCRDRSFDTAYYPGIRRAETNRYNVLAEPFFYEGASALLSSRRAEFIRRYKFYIEPATDDRPYFFHFFKWRTLPEIVALRGRGGIPLLEWAYPLLIAALLQACLASLALILLPLAATRSSGARPSARSRAGAYFLALGLAFLFVEIAFIQKFVLFLSHPLYAIAVVLSAFLIFAGIGSGLSVRWSGLWQRWLPGRPGLPILMIVLLIGCLGLLYLYALPPLFRRWMALPGLIKVPVTITLIAPLALCMGMPFPLGLSRVGRSLPAFVPWAWALNGCASVLSAILATVLSIHFGFSGVVILALVLYGAAALCLWRPFAQRDAGSDP